MKWLHWSPYYELHSHYSPLLNKHFMSAKIWWLIWLESLFLNHSPAANRLVAEWWLAYWNRRLSAEQVHNAAHLWSSTSMSIFIGLYSLVIIDKKKMGLWRMDCRRPSKGRRRLNLSVCSSESQPQKRRAPNISSHEFQSDRRNNLLQRTCRITSKHMAGQSVA